MSVLVIDSHGSHAAVVRLLMTLGAFDVFYYSDTRLVPFDELSAFTRVSRLLKLLDTQSRQNVSVAVLLGRGMSSAPRDAVELGARRAGIELVHAVDIVADRACTGLDPAALCLVGDSCMTEADVRDRLGRRELLEVRACRIAPLHGLDEPLVPILHGWGKRIGGYVLATPDNRRAAAQITRCDPGAELIDEHEHLALALAERLSEGTAPRLRVCVTEQTDAVTARFRARLGVKDIAISEMGSLEATPTEGPYSISLDADGQAY